MVSREIINRFKGKKIAVIGDILLDSYLYTKPNRISPEAPVLISDVQNEEFRLGGAGNVARNLKALGCDPVLIGTVGSYSGSIVMDLLKKTDIVSNGIIVDDDYPTHIKQRVMAGKQQLLRLDRGVPKSITYKIADELFTTLKHALKHNNICGIVLSDYGKGLLTTNVLEVIISENRNVIPICVDPKRINYKNYRGVYLITPNLAEAEEMSDIKITDLQTLANAGNKIMIDNNIDYCLITRGSEGMSLFDKKLFKHTYLPAHQQEMVYDVTGAGDTVISTMAACISAGSSAKEAMVIANIAAGIVIKTVGCGVVTSRELLENL